MEFIKPGINIDFIGKRKIAYALSLTVILIGVISLILHKGPKLGVDFAGGTSIQLKFKSSVSIDNIKSGFANINIKNITVQQFGEKIENEFLINTDQSVATSDNFEKKINDALKLSAKSDVEIRRVEMVGPQVGKDLREKALLAIFYSLIFTSIYIAGRFEFKWVSGGIMALILVGTVYFISLFKVSIPFLIILALILTVILFFLLDLRYSMGAIISLAHDVVVTIAFFSIFDKEFNLPIIAAILTIIGYSLNDTIVIFDRIRENKRKYIKESFEVIINRSINETLSRTILTSGTVLIVVIVLFFLGGGIIHDFMFALLVGFISGVYSTVYIASPIILDWPEKFLSKNVKPKGK